MIILLSVNKGLVDGGKKAFCAIHPTCAQWDWNLKTMREGADLKCPSFQNIDEQLFFLGQGLYARKQVSGPIMVLVWGIYSSIISWIYRTIVGLLSTVWSRVHLEYITVHIITLPLLGYNEGNKLWQCTHPLFSVDSLASAITVNIDMRLIFKHDIIPICILI